jgi:hypothetical protein
LSATTMTSSRAELLDLIPRLQNVAANISAEIF